ncbi:hypothetical protein COCMIDRAFT_31635 [Bipolaris oryzae ATCC 44560]|uniref:Uncharacterized protein n=1 Tax=Bipolaris oryzae ATCC 44560 TaxID=930090 RepID=W7A4J8_COCMI|nr:uncharacterized protein COCMIDRAFT_31635 [Bipolaris oryzae ATCC 44560]EUC51076.1 hypothetical protein COCMIDRAFT_31635 [Bipolaris oryzae ATCC 44560]
MQKLAGMLHASDVRTPIRYQLSSKYYYNLSFVTSFYKIMATMFKCEAAVRDAERAERNALATTQDKTGVKPFLFKDENEILQEKIEENEKYRDILLHMVKRHTEALLPPKANTGGAEEHASAVTNPNNANYRPAHHHDPNYLKTPKQAEHLNPQTIDYEQQLRTKNEERAALTAKLRIVQKERAQVLCMYKSLRERAFERRTEEQVRQYRRFMAQCQKERANHAGQGVQGGNGVQGGKVKKERGDMKPKLRKHTDKGSVDREVSETFLERLESNLVIREKADDMPE